MIEQLAEKYWNGECTDAEERLLKDSLLWGTPPAGLETLAAYLRFQEEERQNRQLDEQFDASLLAAITSQPKRRRLRLRYEWAVAATLALAISMMILINSKVEPPAAQSTATLEFVGGFDYFGDAFQEVRNALLLMSTSMNEGLKHLALLGELDKQKQRIKQDSSLHNKK